MADTKKVQSETTPSLMGILTDVQAQIDALAKQAEEAKAGLEGQFAPFRAKRDVLRASKAELAKERTEGELAARTERDAAFAPIQAAYEAKVTALDADLKPKVEALDAKMAKLIKDVEKATGAPEVLFNADLKPEPKTRTSKGGATGGKTTARKTIDLSDIGELAPVVVIAPKRYPNPEGDKFDVVRYEVGVDADNVYVLRGVKVGHTTAEGELEVESDPFAKEYSHESRTPSQVISQQGWHNTPDVMFALAQHAGATCPEGFGPTSDPSTIGVYDASTKEFVYLVPAGTPETEAVEETV